MSVTGRAGTLSSPMMKSARRSPSTSPRRRPSSKHRLPGSPPKRSSPSHSESLVAACRPIGVDRGKVDQIDPGLEVEDHVGPVAPPGLADRCRRRTRRRRRRPASGRRRGPVADRRRRRNRAGRRRRGRRRAGRRPRRRRCWLSPLSPLADPGGVGALLGADQPHLVAALPVGQLGADEAEGRRGLAIEEGVETSPVSLPAKSPLIV